MYMIFSCLINGSSSKPWHGSTLQSTPWHWLMPIEYWSKYTTELTYSNFSNFSNFSQKLHENLFLMSGFIQELLSKKMDFTDPRKMWYWIEHWIITRILRPLPARSLVWIQTYKYFKFELIPSGVVYFLFICCPLK